jgi:clan AA aspartic protease
MGQVHVQVVLTNYRETVMAHLGHLPTSEVHRIEVAALVDTGAMRSVLPPAVADELGLLRLGRTVARYADGRLEEVDTTEGFYIALLGRQALEDAMVLGDRVLLGVTALEKMDLLVDCPQQRVIPNPANPQQPVFRV